jgi:hypothetical protein
MNRGIAIAGIWIGVGLVGIGAGIAGVDGASFGCLAFVALCAMIATFVV